MIFWLIDRRLQLYVSEPRGIVVADDHHDLVELIWGIPNLARAHLFPPAVARDRAQFPPFSGRKVHYPMATETVGSRLFMP